MSISKARRRPARRHGHLPVTGLVVLAVALVTFLYPIAPVRADDVCPEPNDEFQRACYLGTASEALGFISRPDDVDGYRFETLDSDVMAHIEVADTPRPYAFIVGDWNGYEVGRSAPGATGAAADVKLPVPGSYFVFVQSTDGTFDATVPYRLGIALTYPYPDGLKPQVKYAESFREPEYAGWLKQLPPVPSDKDADFFEIGGRYIISVNKPGIAQDWPRVASPTFGPDLDDFVMTVDARACDQDVATGYAGYRIGFRWQDPFHQYSLAVNVEGRRAWLNKVDGSSMKETVELTEPTRSTFIDNKGGINRTTIRAQGNTIRISINGGEIINTTDSSFSHGKFNFVAAAWSKARPLARFDNVLITSPSVAAPGGAAQVGDANERRTDRPPLPCTPF